jgi:hypothetical protein
MGRRPDLRRTCPLRLLSERALEEGRPPQTLLLQARLVEEAERGAVIRQWVDGVWATWTEHWNTLNGDDHDAVARWRAGLLRAAL